MSKKLYPETDIQNIANAIRALNGSTDTYTVSEMASAIALPENGFYLKDSTEANPLSITDGEELNAQSCEVSFEPIQNLHGYDSPWIDSDVINKEPYLMRAVGGTATRIGNSLYDKLVGGTVAFNQLVQNGNFADTSNWTVMRNVTLSASGNVLSVTATADGDNRAQQEIPMIVGHKYLCRATTKTDSTTNTTVLILFYGEPQNQIYKNKKSSDGWTTDEFVVSCVSNTVNQIRLQDVTSGVTNQYKNIVLYDLTAMFGSTIADYIYSLEQATAGSGVAYFKSLFPKDYYDYNVGQLMSVKALSHKMVGFNAFNVTTGKAKLLGGNQYQITGTYTALSYSTGETLTPNSNGKFTPSASGELTVTGGNNTTCVHLVWDGERDGEYEAYEEHIYPLDSDLELRGIPKLDANNKLYYDGDTYESDGTVTRKYGIVDLGTLDWTYSSTRKVFITSSAVSGIKIPSSTAVIPNVICKNYIAKEATSVYNDAENNNKCIAIIATGALAISDQSYNDEQAFKTAMSGVYLVYELATPTTETADTFQNPQLVSNWGTEEYTDSREVQIPVGHETYQANICEISGWSGLVLNQCGKNQFDKNSVTVSSITFENNDEHNTITRSGFFYHLPAGTYTLNCNSTTATNYIYANVLDSNGSFKGNVKLSSATETWIPKTVTLSNGDYLVIYKATSGQPFPSYDIMLQIELGTEATSYEPYQGKTYTATFPDTVYGGKLDFVSGKLFVDRIVETITSVEYYGLYGTDNAPLFYFDLQNAVKNYQNNTQPIENKLMSNEYSPISTETVADMKNSECRTQAANITYRIYFRDDRFTSKADINEWVVNNPIQITGKLATPQEITLTPEIIALLKGNNVLWTDGDNVKLKYFSKSLS